MRFRSVFILLLLSTFPGLLSAQIDLMEFLKPKNGISYEYAAVFTHEGETRYDTSVFIWRSRLLKRSEVAYDGYPNEGEVTRYSDEDFKDTKIYYLWEPKDTCCSGPNHFLFSAIAFIQSKKEIALAPFFFDSELDKLSTSSFTGHIPQLVNTTDTLKIIDGEKNTLLYGFIMEDVEIPSHQGKISCLKIEQTEQWPKKSYHGTVWISREYGLVKRIRGTGRTEVLVLH